MISGSVYLFNDPNQAFGCINQNTKCIVVSEDIPIDQNNQDVISGSVLLPPASARIAEVDGNAEAFYEYYYGYLISDPVVDYISVILGYLHRGGNIAMLVTAEITDNWVTTLCNHFMMYYGIQVGIGGVLPFSYDARFNDTINDILYSADLVSDNEYLAGTTQQFIPGNILHKLNANMAACMSNDLNDLNKVYHDISAMMKVHVGDGKVAEQVPVTFDPRNIRVKGWKQC